MGPRDTRVDQLTANDFFDNDKITVAWLSFEIKWPWVSSDTEIVKNQHCFSSRETVKLWQKHIYIVDISL